MLVSSIRKARTLLYCMCACKSIDMAGQNNMTGWLLGQSFFVAKFVSLRIDELFVFCSFLL